MRFDEPLEQGQRNPPVPPNRVAVASAESGRDRQFRVLYGEEVVGTTRIEFPIEIGKRAAGFFVPAAGYRAVRDVFRLYRFAEADHPNILRRFVHERDNLGLTVFTGEGEKLDASVDLISEWQDGRFVVHISVEDPRFWR